MKLPRRLLPFVGLLLALVPALPSVHAQGTFPGLKQVLTAAEWKRAGLDSLTPDQIGVIDAALIRFSLAEQKRALAVVQAPLSAEAPAGATAAEAAVLRSRFWEKFGFEKISGDWRSHPPMKAKVSAWQGGNKFALDTGQVWEGLEPIASELLGRDVAIEARPAGGYALKIGDESMEFRVRRVR